METKEKIRRYMLPRSWGGLTAIFCWIAAIIAAFLFASKCNNGGWEAGAIIPTLDPLIVTPVVHLMDGFGNRISAIFALCLFPIGIYLIYLIGASIEATVVWIWRTTRKSVDAGRTIDSKNRYRYAVLAVFVACTFVGYYNVLQNGCPKTPGEMYRM